jgi:hypothetical protein
VGWNQSLFPLLIITESGGFSGEFIYAPAPGPGALVFSNTAQGGTDPYGNTYLAGSTWYGPSGVINIPPDTSALLAYSPAAATGDLSISLATTAGTDQFGNPYPAGLRWNTTIQTMPGMTAGWNVGGHATYAFDPIGNLVVSFKDLQPGAVADMTPIWGAGSVLAAYRPANNRRIVAYADQLKATGGGFEACALEFQTDGSVQIFGVAAGATRVDLFASIPLAF